MRVDPGKRREHLCEPAAVDYCHHRQSDQAEQHQQPVHEIRPGHCFQPADHRVEKDDPQAENGACGEIHAQKTVESFPARIELGSDIAGNHGDQDYRGDPADNVAGVCEPVLQVVRHCDRVVLVSENFERARHQKPAYPHSQGLAQDDPGSVQAESIAHAGQAKQQPAALASGVRAETDYPEAKFLAGCIVAVNRVALLAAEYADQHQGQEIKHH